VFTGKSIKKIMEGGGQQQKEEGEKEREERGRDPGKKNGDEEETRRMWREKNALICLFVFLPKCRRNKC